MKVIRLTAAVLIAAGCGALPLAGPSQAGALSGQPPPNTFITTTPLETIHDPTPTFEFSASYSDSTFQCRVDGGAFAPCTSPKTVAHLHDGSHTFAVRAHNSAGFDPTPATDTFKLTTASVSRSGSTLTVTTAAGAEDNIGIRKLSASTIRITDSPGGAYAGSGVHVGAGCTRVGDYAANCSASGISLVNVMTRDQNDRVTNLTHLRSALNGGAGADVLLGGSVSDTITGGPGADTMKGMNGNDTLLGRDLTDDATINCDGDTVPGLADHANLDTLPNDRPASGCESVTRH